MTLAGMNGREPGEDEIRRILASHTRTAPRLAAGVAYRPAAVLLPLIQAECGWSVLYTRRTEKVLDHKGQVAFPGGAADPEDQSPVETAIRESYEEIGLTADRIHILGILDEYPTITGYLVTTVVARIDWPFEPILSIDEVERIFTIPLHWLAKKLNRREEPRQRPDGISENVIYYELYEGELLWGITARITVKFLETIGMML